MGGRRGWGACLREDQKPLELGAQGGFQAPFDGDNFKRSLTANGIYRCGFNLFMTNLSWTATPGVPIVQGRIDTLVQYSFLKPGPIPFDFVIRVPTADYDPLRHKGALQCVSPEEVKVAFMMALARDVLAEGLADREAVLKGWKRAALSITATFKLLQTEDDVFFEAFNLREKLANDFQALARTTFQRIYEVAQFRARKLVSLGASASHKRICDEFNNRAELAATSEPVNVDFIQKALAVHAQAFSLPAVLKAITTLESLCGKSSPYDALGKLNGIVRKAKEPAIIEWTFCTITDLVISGRCGAKDFPERWLLGEGPNARGAVDTFIAKYKLLEYLLTVAQDQLGTPTHVKEKMRAVLKDHESYRKHLKPLDGSSPDLSWRAGWARSAVMAMSFIERAAYGEDFDPSLRTAVRMCKSPEDIMHNEAIAAKWTEVTDMAKQEEEEERKRKVAEAPEGEAGDSAAATAAPAAAGAVALAGETDASTSAEQRLQLEAERMVNSNITLLIEPDSQTELKNAIMSSAAGKVEGREGQERLCRAKEAAMQLIQFPRFARALRRASRERPASRPIGIPGLPVGLKARMRAREGW